MTAKGLSMRDGWIVGLWVRMVGLRREGLQTVAESYCEFIQKKWQEPCSNLLMAPAPPGCPNAYIVKWIFTALSNVETGKAKPFHILL